MRAPARCHERSPALALGAGAALFLALLPGCGDNYDLCRDEVPGAVCPVAGTGETGFNRDGKPPEETDFYLITRARRGPDGRLYFMDFNNWRIRRLGDDGLIHTFAGNGFHAPAIDGAPALESPLDNPTDFDFLPAGDLVTVSMEDPRVLGIRDQIIYVIAGAQEPGTVGDEGDGGPAHLARFIQLRGIAAAPDGALYLADAGAHRVRVIRDGIIDTVAGSGTAGYSGDGGAARAAQLNFPTALALDGAGRLLIADSLNHALRRVNVDGTIETIAGVGEPGNAGDGGPAAEAALDEPNGVAVDERGIVYIADRRNFRVRRIDAEGTIDNLAGTVEGYAGDGGPAAAARFGFLARVTLDGNRLLVADQSNGCIRAVVLEP